MKWLGYWYVKGFIKKNFKKFQENEKGIFQKKEIVTF